MLIRILNTNDVDNVTELFTECFFNDHYYISMFPDEATRKSDMSLAFKPNLFNCIQQNMSYGVFENGSIIAFILLFNYKKFKNENQKAFFSIFGAENNSRLPYYERLHKKIDVLNGETVFLLSVAVKNKYRSMGIASGLIDYVLAKYPGFNIAGDVSNTKSLEIYSARNFRIEEIEPDYNLIIKTADSQNHTVAVNDCIDILVPDITLLNDNSITYTIIKQNKFLFGYENSGFFKEKSDSVCCGTLVKMPYGEYLKYQRVINISIFIERFCGDFAFFYIDKDHTYASIKNDILNEMLASRKSEWSIIPDVFVSVPVRYTDISLLKRCCYADDTAGYLLKNLDFRTKYELGIQSSLDSVDEFASCKNRIKRYYLGKVKLQISTEITVDHYNSIGEPIGGANYVDLYVTVDENSECAVISWYSMSSPFLISHYFDNIIRNQVLAIHNGTALNLFDFLNNEFGITKRGTPKIYTVIPGSKDILKPGQIASLLTAETIYPDGENFGEIIDDEILGIINSPNGMGQYDRACVYAYTNTVLQFQPEFKGSVNERIAEEAITQFYIELVLLQEAAIHIADKSISVLFTEEDAVEPVDFLERVDKIYDEYSKTIDFWDIQVNYPTSQKSITMLRSSFRIQDQLSFLKRDLEHLDMVFDTKCDIADRKDSKRMEMSLAIISMLAIFSAWIDSHDFIGTWSGIFSQTVISVLQWIAFVVILIIAIYVMVHIFGKKTKKLIKKHRSR